MFLSYICKPLVYKLGNGYRGGSCIPFMAKKITFGYIRFKAKWVTG